MLPVLSALPTINPTDFTALGTLYPADEAISRSTLNSGMNPVAINTDMLKTHQIMSKPGLRTGFLLHS
jgi:hypothetical protein